MDARVVAQLEERLAGLQDTSQARLHEFEDADLALHPAIEIPETNFSIEEYENIASNLARMAASGDDQSLVEAARGIAVLAYNTLMDPIDGQRPQLIRHNSPKPFFHKYRSGFTEEWLRTTGLSTLDLRSLSKQIGPDESEMPVLRLIRQSANEFERKSSIGKWAFSQLKARRHRGPLRKVGKPRHLRPDSMETLYGFSSSYKFPNLGRELSESLRRKFLDFSSGEIKYLFYRAAITLDKFHGEAAQFRSQIDLLMSLAFGGQYGLRYSGMWLWHDFQAAARKLRIPNEHMFDLLEWALQDSSWARYAGRSLGAVRALKKFYLEYECNPGRSRYYVYARLINRRYFDCTDWRGNRELILALNRIYLQSGSDLWTESPYKEWGELLAAKILDSQPMLDYQSHNPRY